MFFRSIRFRLTAWYALTLAVTLTASSLFWYVALSRNLLNHIDERLLDVAKTVEKKHIQEHHNIDMYEACSGLDAYIIDHNWAGHAQVRNNLGNLICNICCCRTGRTIRNDNNRIKNGRNRHWRQLGARCFEI